MISAGLALLALALALQALWMATIAYRGDRERRLRDARLVDAFNGLRAFEASSDWSRLELDASIGRPDQQPTRDTAGAVP